MGRAKAMPTHEILVAIARMRKINTESFEKHSLWLLIIKGKRKYSIVFLQKLVFFTAMNSMNYKNLTLPEGTRSYQGGAG